MVIKKKEIEENKLLIETIDKMETPFYIGDEDDWFEAILARENRRELAEGLIKTYPYDFAISRFNKYGVATSNQDKTQIYLYLKDKTKCKFIGEYANTLGYFVSQYKILFNGKDKSPINYVTYKTLEEFNDKINKINELWLIIEAKFDSNLSNEIDYLYHLTEKSKLNKIKVNGLTPKSNSKKAYHPERIYVVPSLNNMKGIIKGFTEDKNINDFTVLKIDYNLTNKPKLYNDPNYFTFGYYLIDNIPPDAIIDIIDASEILNQ